jgi:hypothetical protein
VHLVCCAANDLAPRDPVANLRRGARSAVLSAFGFGVGDAAAGWAGGAPAPNATPPAADAGGPLPPESLGAAMTASAAAFNSQMGLKSVQLGPAVTFLMAALNLRLGRWLPHPDPRLRRRPERLFPGLGFYRELLGQTSAEAPSVHLSDGAHFENLALYELVRRQCRYILVSDCGADPDVAFDDFGTLIRRVRQDFGAEIDVDLRPLMPGADGRAERHVVAGSVHYPTGDTGVLLYVKPAVIGDEPPDVAQYRARNPQFPHETTADQFYDEAQWESYRRLGVHTARAAFLGPMQRLGLASAARGGERAPAWDGGAADARRAGLVFTHAHRQWLPVPDGFVARAPERAAQFAALDAALYEAALRAGAATPHPSAPAWADPVRTFFWELDDASRARPDLPVAVLEDALPLIRRAALCMEETFHAERLAHHSRHPVYLGTLNYFARWGRLPAMRFWWPVLRALHAPAFVAWAEKEFRLPGPAADPDVEGSLHYRLAEREFRPAEDQSYVERCWLEGDRRAHDGRDTRLELTAALPWGGGAVEVAVGQLLVRHADAEAGGAARRVAVFDADWLFVPMGLWGVGTGEALLARCRRARADVLAWADGLLVRVPATPRFGLAGRRASAATTQLFRGQGFLEVYADADGVVRVPADSGGPLEVATAAVLPGEGAAARWLYRPVHHDARPGAAAAAPGAGGPRPAQRPA